MRCSRRTLSVLIAVFALLSSCSLFFGKDKSDDDSDSDEKTELSFTVTGKDLPGESFWAMAAHEGKVYAAGDGGIYEFKVQEETWSMAVKDFTYAYRVGFFNTSLYFMNAQNIGKVGTDGRVTTIQLPNTDAEPTDFCINGNEIYVADFGYTHKGTWNFPSNGQGVFFSNDGGGTWALRNSGLDSVHVGRIKTAKDGTMYCSAVGGLYKFVQASTRWEKVFGLADGIVMEFDFFYNTQGALDSIYAITSSGLIKCSLSTSAMSTYAYPSGISPHGLSLSIDSPNNRMVTTHWNEGVIVWNLADMSNHVYLQRSVWNTCAVLSGGVAIVGAYGGFLSSYVIDPVAMTSRRIDKGLAGDNNIRSAIAHNGEYFYGATSGIISNNGSSENKFTEIFDADTQSAIGEIMCMKINPLDSLLYFQDYDSGIWRYRSGAVQKVSLLTGNGSTLPSNIGAGTDFAFVGDHLYVVNSKEHSGRFGGLRVYLMDTTEGKAVLQTEANGLPSFFYGYGSKFDIDSSCVSLTVTPEGSTSMNLYVSSDQGAAFSQVDSNVGLFNATMNGVTYYLKDGSVWHYNYANQSKEAIGVAAHMIFKFDTYLVCVDDKSVKVRSRDRLAAGSSEISYSYDMPHRAKLYGVWGSGFALVTANQIFFFEVRSQ